MFRLNKLPGSKIGKPSTGKKRTRRHMRQKYGDYVPSPQATKWAYIKLIAILTVFGLIIMGTLYAIFG